MILIYGEKNQNDIISSKLKNYSTIILNLKIKVFRE